MVGLGYVGLPLVLRFVEVGYRVLGIDIDAEKIALLQSGKSYIDHIGSASVASARERGFEATGSFERIPEVDAIIICVPPP